MDYSFSNAMRSVFRKQLIKFQAVFTTTISRGEELIAQCICMSIVYLWLPRTVRLYGAWTDALIFCTLRDYK